MNNKVMALDLILRRPLARVAVWLLLAAGTVYAATAAADNTMGTAVDELGRISTQIVRSAWRSEQGIESTFPELAGQVEQFDAQKDRLDSSRLAAQLSQLEVSWQPVKRAAQALVEAGPDITFVHSLAAGYQREMDSMQREFAQVASLTRARNGTGATTAVAQQNLWLNERISRNIHRVLAGDPASEQAAQALRADSDELLRNIEALTRGDAARGIDKLVDPAAIENLSSAFRKFSPISTAVDRIVGSAGELREAAASRELILSSGDSLGESIAALRSAVNGLAVSAPAQDGVLTPLLLVLLLLSLCLCGYQFLLRRRSAGQLGQGMTSINTALQKLGEGDLAQRIEEKGGPMAEVAAKINHTAQRQYELVENIRAPFDRAL